MVKQNVVKEFWLKATSQEGGFVTWEKLLWHRPVRSQCSLVQQSRCCLLLLIFCWVHPSNDLRCFSLGWRNPKKCPSPWGIWTPSNTWVLGSTRVNHPHSISISSAGFAGLENVTNRRTDQADHRLVGFCTRHMSEQSGVSMSDWLVIKRRLHQLWWGGCRRGHRTPLWRSRVSPPEKFWKRAKSCILLSTMLISGFPRMFVSEQTTSMSRAKSFSTFQPFCRVVPLVVRTKKNNQMDIMKQYLLWNCLRFENYGQEVGGRTNTLFVPQPTSWGTSLPRSLYGCCAYGQGRWRSKAGKVR